MSGLWNAILRFTVLPPLLAAGACSHGSSAGAAKSHVTPSSAADPALGHVIQGALERTNRPLDLAIQGNGFFVVQTSKDGRVSLAFTRHGVFYLNAKNEMVRGIGDGFRLSPPITMPRGTAEIWIGQDGSISCLHLGSAERQHVGQIRLARFRNPTALTRDAESGLLFANDRSGPAVLGAAAEQGAGNIEQGFLETGS